MKPLSQAAKYLAHVSLRAQIDRIMIDAAPERIQDADPVPARLTEAAQPVFRTSRKLPRSDSASALSMGRDIAAMCGHDAGRIEKFAAAVLGNANVAARAVNRWPADLGALPHG